MIAWPPFPYELAVMAVAMGIGTAVAIYKIKRMELRQEEGEVVEEQQLSFEDAVANRNDVLDAVGDNNVDWLKTALEAMKAVPDGHEATGEGFRMLLLESGLAPPRGSGAWGALTGQLVRKKILVRTGERKPMLDPKAHGRATDVYVKRTPEAA